MAGWTPFNGWMRFPRLDDGAGLTSAFTLAFKITDDPLELWSERFARFKNKDGPAYFGAAAVLQPAVDQLLAHLGLDMNDTVFVCALSSGETEADPHRMVPHIASLCGGFAGARVELGAVSKHAHRRIHDLGGAAARGAELDAAAYTVAKLCARNVIVFDDFITRGGTMSRVARAAIATNPGVAVYGVALGKTERRSWFRSISNDHVSQEWDALWRKGEEDYHKQHV